MNAIRLKYALASLATGALMVAALPPYNLWPFMFAGFAGFYALLSTLKTPRAAFACGWLFGFGYFAAGLWWIANALLVDGNEFRWVWPFTIAGLPALLGFFPGLAAMAAMRFTDLKRLGGFLAFTASFALSEWLRGHIFTGFPWNLYGYAWSGWLDMAQIVAVGGAYFLTLLTLFWTTLPGFLFVWPTVRKNKTIVFGIALITFAAIPAYGHLRLQNAATSDYPGLAIRPVQANITQAEKWNPEKAPDNLRRMLTLSVPEPGKPEAPLTILVWPETALEYDVLANENARAMIKAALAQYKNSVYLVTGLLRYEPQPGGKGRYYNSLVVLDRDLNLRAVYNKAHLVPFGEYIPFQDMIPMHPFVQFQGFTEGTALATLNLDGAPSFSPLVCYEVIFPGAVIAAPRPGWIVNITNDAWYGDSPGPRQHFAMTRFRAIEEGLPVVRAAETGISGVIDPFGRVTWQAPLNQMAAQSLSLPQPLPPTPYARMGDMLFFACLLASACGALTLRNKKSA